MKALHLISAVLVSVGLIALAYWLTFNDSADPCAQDVPAAAIADEGLDQENLVDRALLKRRDCPPQTTDDQGN